MMPDEITIELITAPTDDVRALIGALDAELAMHYASEQRHGLNLDAIFQPHVRFFLARVNGDAIGCGGIALFEDFAEIKRMFVRPEMRGTGIAEAIIARLAAEALDAGLSVLRLETGVHQKAAIRFYERCGFTRCAAFEPYTSMPAEAISTSVFMEKVIDVG